MQPVAALCSSKRWLASCPRQGGRALRACWDGSLVHAGSWPPFHSSRPSVWSRASLGTCMGWR
eukprot:12553849-Alexandrium_andersonii.AAC.1